MCNCCMCRSIEEAFFCERPLFDFHITFWSLFSYDYKCLNLAKISCLFFQEMKSEQIYRYEQNNNEKEVDIPSGFTQIGENAFID